MKLHSLSILFASALLATSCGVPQYSETVNVEVVINPEGGGKKVKLINIEDNRIESAKFEGFFRASEKDYRNGILHFVGSDSSADLGMGSVPVLDQGQFGTCVTFSSTAALDAKLGRGDFISQQCSLALDKGMGNDYWNGAYYPSEIIDPLQNYGVVEKSRCPSSYPDDAQYLDSATYQGLADKAASAQVKAVKYAYGKADLNAMKAALKAGHRVVFAFLINAVSQEAVQGFNIKVDGQKYTGGLWACKQPGSASNYCQRSNAGHEVVAIGYDDKQQLLKIRNSWSADVGDKGDYYMTYAFFGTMAVDQTIIY